MAADPHKYPYIFGWAFKEVRGNWIHILRQRICETRDASDTELRDMALSMFMPPVPQDYHQDATRCGVVAGGSADVTVLDLQAYSQTGVGGAVAFVVGYVNASVPTPNGITPKTDFSIPTFGCGRIFDTIYRSKQAAANNVYASIDRGNSWQTTADIMPLSATWNAFVQTGSKGIAIATGPSAATAYTYDGNQWFAGASMPSSSYWSGICYANNCIVVSGGDGFAGASVVTAYSNDLGVTWNAGGDMPANGHWVHLEYIGSRFVAGQLSAAGAGAVSVNNGVSWAALNYPTAYSSFWVGPFAFNGHLAWVSDDSINKILLSSDGVVFSYATLPFADYWQVFYVNGYYYASAYNAKQCYRSTDMASWTLYATTPTALRYNIAHGFDDNTAALLGYGWQENAVLYAPGVTSASYTAAGGAVAGGGSPIALSALVSGGAVVSVAAATVVLCLPVVTGGAAAQPYGSPVAICAASTSGGAVVGPYAPIALSGVVSGGAVAGGVAPEGFYISAIGGAVAGGSVPEGLTQVVTGGAVVAGTADASIQTSSQIYSYGGDGGGVVSISSTLQITVVPVMSGGAVSAAVSVIVALAVKAGLVTTVAGGAAVESVQVVSVVAGGAVVGGTAPFSSNTLANEYSYTSAGGSVSGGVAENIQYAYPVTTGAAVASGGIVVRVTATVPITGGAVAAGNTVLLQSAIRAVVGGAVALPAGDTSIGWTGDKTVQAVAGGAAGIVASIALYGSVTAVSGGGVTVRATAYADSYGGAVGGGAAPFIGYGVLSLVVTASAVAGGAGAVSSMAFSPSIQILWSVEDYQPRFMGSSADNRFYGVDTQIRFTGE